MKVISIRTCDEWYHKFSGYLAAEGISRAEQYETLLFLLFCAIQKQPDNIPTKERYYLAVKHLKSIL